MEKKTTRITTLEEHRNLLKTVLKTAKSRVLVVSPFIADSAIRHDRIPELVSDAVHRGVRVDVFTDDKLNRLEDGAWKPAAKAGMASLAHAGANVSIVSGIHNKTLARDEDLVAEGSFNWLSAVRTKGADMQRQERTLVYEGEEVKGMVEREVDTLNRTTEDMVKTRKYKDELTLREKTRIWTFFGILLMINILAWFAGHKAPWQQWSMWVITIVGVIDAFLLIGFLSSFGSDEYGSRPSNVCQGHPGRSKDYYTLFVNPTYEATYSGMRGGND